MKPPSADDARVPRPARDDAASVDHRAHTDTQGSVPVSLHGLPLPFASTQADAVAVVDQGGRQTSYHELVGLAGALARRLVAAGVKRGDLVGIATRRDRVAIVAMLGVSAAGAAYVPLDPEWPAARAAFVMEDAGLRVVVIDDSAQDLPDCATIAVTDADIPNAGAHVLPTVGPKDAAYVLYTSGSTGRPKGVIVEHGSVVNLVAWGVEALEVKPSSRVLCSSSLSFDVSVFEIFGPLAAGAAVVMASEEDRRDPRRLQALMAGTSITHLQFTPSMWEVLLDSGIAPPRGSTMISAGEQLGGSLVTRLTEYGDLWNLYGPTEATVYATGERFPCGGAWDGTTPPIGRPVAGAVVRVREPTGGDDVQPGVVGELYIGGPGVACGYHAQQELTAERFLVFEGEPGRWYRTGDLVRQDESGRLEYVGRLDRQVKIRGHRVELDELEVLLADCDSVANAAVATWEPNAGDLRIVAFVVGRPDVALTRKELRTYLRSRVPEYMVPSRFVILEKMPMTANGKIDRSMLDHGPEAAAKLAEVRRWLTALWEDLLEIDEVHPNDDFYELGGHSLLGMRMVGSINERYGLDLPVTAVLRRPTVAQIAERVVDRD